MNTSTSTRASSSSSSSTTTPRDLRPQLQSQPQQQRQQSLASLTHKLTDHVLTTFDRVIAQTLATHDEVINKIPVIKMKGKLKQYRLVDDIWKLWVEDVEIAVGSERRRRRRQRPGNVKADLRDGGSVRGGGKGELGAKRKRDGCEDGDSEERAQKRSRGDGGNGIEQGKKDDDGKGPEVIRVDKLLIVACDGREPDAGKKQKKRGG
ncbi:uncharacterized protein B0T23DRAFT_369873 [Neurospora hispaniola]|uniref:Uncharacterized protein n=1 Tax=Neurospora hispaniola TaxID=588809 RepID=A0AAJ0IFI4_9PEZI|nr:hypothetical protein B0T23DRAFT_369873 [Neurospora hispaniola]